MSLTGVLFLAGYTARSQAYAQAMAAANLAPESVLLFGAPDAQDPAPPASAGGPAAATPLLLPDLDVPLAETCAGAGWPTDRVAAGDVNDAEIARHVRDRHPRWVVYSGYGGQIVGAAALGLGADFLHLHVGWLPDYRGSTTLYYSWLERGTCAVTALILDKGIDSGPIVTRRRYPLPPPGIDVDLVYDSAIRADLLVDVLGELAETGRLPRIEDSGDGVTYYVIHPVLKHIALLSRETAAPDCPA